jgi:hypothetical protein
MLHLAFAELMQAGPPLPKLRQVFCDALRKQDVTGIAAIHYALCDVDPGAGNVTALVDIFHLTHRAAVNPHPHTKAGLPAQGPIDLQRAFYWRFD